MLQKLPIESFKWVEEISQFNEDCIEIYNEDCDVGYILEVDIQYPEKFY